MAIQMTPAAFPGDGFDVAVVGAGIVGLAHALAAVRLGKRVVVIDRDAHANGASIRNFGFVTVTGQQAGDCWRRAMRSRDIWAEVAPQAGIAVEQRGACIVARRPEAKDVLAAFLQTDMGRDCRLITPAQAAEHVPALRRNAIQAALWSPHDLRVESRTAIPALARWLAEAWGVTFLRSTLVKDIAPPHIDTTRGWIDADVVIVCPGTDFQTLYADRIAAQGVRTCQLHMLRLEPPQPMRRLATPVMSDLSMGRYLGFAELPQAAALKQRLAAEQAAALEHGVHLIVVQSADGSLVVGDSHHYGETIAPFAPTLVDDVILEEFDAVFDLPGRRVQERWVGSYATADDKLMLVDRPSDDVRIVMVTSGTGASTGFAIGEEVIGELFGSQKL